MASLGSILLFVGTDFSYPPQKKILQALLSRELFFCYRGREPYGTDACRDCTAGFYQDIAGWWFQRVLEFSHLFERILGCPAGT